MLNSNNSNNSINSNPIFYHFSSGDGFIKMIYHHHPNLEPKKVNDCKLRVDNLKEHSLSIEMGQEYLYAIINNEYEVHFEDDIGEEAFFEELNFILEEVNDTKGSQRISSSKKDIKLEDVLDSLRETTKSDINADKNTEENK